ALPDEGERREEGSEEAGLTGVDGPVEVARGFGLLDEVGDLPGLCLALQDAQILHHVQGTGDEVAHVFGACLAAARGFGIDGGYAFQMGARKGAPLVRRR